MAASISRRSSSRLPQGLVEGHQVEFDLGLARGLRVVARLGVPHPQGDRRNPSRRARQRLRGGDPVHDRGRPLRRVDSVERARGMRRATDHEESQETLSHDAFIRDRALDEVEVQRAAQRERAGERRDLRNRPQHPGGRVLFVGTRDEENTACARFVSGQDLERAQSRGDSALHVERAASEEPGAGRAALLVQIATHVVREPRRIALEQERAQGVGTERDRGARGVAQGLVVVDADGVVMGQQQRRARRASAEQRPDHGTPVGGRPFARRDARGERFTDRRGAARFAVQVRAHARQRDQALGERAHALRIDPVHRPRTLLQPRAAEKPLSAGRARCAAGTPAIRRSGIRPSPGATTRRSVRTSAPAAAGAAVRTARPAGGRVEAIP